MKSEYKLWRMFGAKILQGLMVGEHANPSHTCLYNIFRLIGMFLPGFYLTVGSPSPGGEYLLDKAFHEPYSDPNMANE